MCRDASRKTCCWSDVPCVYPTGKMCVAFIFHISCTIHGASCWWIKILLLKSNNAEFLNSMQFCTASWHSVINVIIVIIENHGYQTSKNGIIYAINIFWGWLIQWRNTKLLWRLNWKITSNIDMYTGELIRGTYPSTTYMYTRDLTTGTYTSTTYMHTIDQITGTYILINYIHVH